MPLNVIINVNHINQLEGDAYNYTGVGGGGEAYDRIYVFVYR